MSLYFKKMSSLHIKLSSYDKGKILAYIKNFNAIQIAKKMGYYPFTIHWFINKYKKTGSIENLLWPEQPSALNVVEKNAFVNEVMKNRCAPLHKDINILNLNCSPTTVKETLYS